MICHSASADGTTKQNIENRSENGAAMCDGCEIVDIEKTIGEGETDYGKK